MSKPFNLEEAKAGKPLVTRDGRDAKFIAHVPELVNSESIIYVCDGWLRFAYESGESLKSKQSESDLFMKTVKKTVYVNLYSAHQPSYTKFTSKIGAESDAKCHAGNSFLAIAVPIEIEE